MNHIGINVSNGEYFVLFRVYFEHDFYTSGYADDIQVAPTRECLEIIQRYGLIYRKTSDGFAVIYKNVPWRKRGVAELLVGDELEMSFVMYTSNPFFNNYTDIPFDNRGQIYDFSNIKGEENSGQLCLHPNPKVGANDLVPITEEIQNLLQHTGIRKIPFGLVKIALEDCQNGYDILKEGQIESPNYYISFAARGVYWRYLLSKEFGAGVSEMVVTERYNKMHFLDVGTVRARSGAEMYSIQSAHKIILKEAHREEILFRAKKKKNGTGMMVKLEMDLPLPSYKKLNPINEELVYTDVFISL